jgi:hypothetical protein
MFNGGLAGVDPSGITFSIKNLPITTFNGDMSFSMQPRDYNIRDFTILGENTLLTAAGSKLSITIPSTLRNYIDLVKSLLPGIVLPSDMDKYYNKPISIPTVVLSYPFGYNAGDDFQADNENSPKNH